jgi:hypothetical protein
LLESWIQGGKYPHKPELHLSQANRELCVGATSLNNIDNFEGCRTTPLIEHYDTAIVDSGCTGIFLLINAPCQNKVKYQNPLIVSLPNGDTMYSTHTASLDIPELSQAASIAHVFPDIADNHLLSIGQLCNEGYYVTFRIDAVIAYTSTGNAIFTVK